MEKWEWRVETGPSGMVPNLRPSPSVSSMNGCLLFSIPILPKDAGLCNYSGFCHVTDAASCTICLNRNQVRHWKQLRNASLWSAPLEWLVIPDQTNHDTPLWS